MEIPISQPTQGFERCSFDLSLPGMMSLLANINFKRACRARRLQAAEADHVLCYGEALGSGRGGPAWLSF